MTGTASLDDAISRVVREGNCSGCGMCALLDTGISMQLDAAGFLRPVRSGSGQTHGTDDPGFPARTGVEAVESFQSACPGVRVDAQRPAGSTRHPTMGPYLQAWAAWATDQEVRERGSSGGAITAITGWLIASGESASVVAAAAEPANPRRTVSVSIQSKADALAAAGSRYAPVANAAITVHGDATVVGKPCEVTALRALARHRDEAAPLLISFFCAGTPSQFATDSLLRVLGVPDGTPLDDLWYRGHGWPGEFTATASDGSIRRASYDESWGGHLGKTVQWRCKLCPDGVGESADITAADWWRADENGYPVFLDSDGVSAIIVRTARGLDVVRRAAAAGVIQLEPLPISGLAAVQPLQVTRRNQLFGRMLGTLLARRRVPRFRGFGLLALGRKHPRVLLRSARATRRRAVDDRRQVLDRAGAYSRPDAPGAKP